MTRTRMPFLTKAAPDGGGRGRILPTGTAQSARILHDDIFAKTLSGLERGLQAQHVATVPFESCLANDDVRVVFGKPEWAGFDFLPVRDRGKVVGILKRESGAHDALVREAMAPLNENMLASAETPLEKVIRRLLQCKFLLVVRRTAIEGIITHSDLAKLPVRLLIFAQVTHLEMEMATAIRHRFGSDDAAWLNLLSRGRRDNLEEKKRHLLQRREEPSLFLELTDFCDKRQILRRCYGLPRQFGDDLEQIEKFVRNPLAHAATFLNDKASLIRVVDLLDKAGQWTRTVRDLGQALGDQGGPRAARPRRKEEDAQEAH